MTDLDSNHLSHLSLCCSFSLLFFFFFFLLWNTQEALSIENQHLCLWYVGTMSLTLALLSFFVPFRVPFLQMYVRSTLQSICFGDEGNYKHDVWAVLRWLKKNGCTQPGLPAGDFRSFDWICTEELSWQFNPRPHADLQSTEFISAVFTPSFGNFVSFMCKHVPLQLLYASIIAR